MHRYSKIRGSRSADFGEPTWKDLSDPKKPNGRIYREQIQEADPPNASSDEDQGRQFGYILTRAMSLKENIKDMKSTKKNSCRNPDAVLGDNSLQGAVKRVFCKRNLDPPIKESVNKPFVADLRGVTPNGDWQEEEEEEKGGQESFKRADSMRYSRIAAPLVESDQEGNDASNNDMKKKMKKKKRSVFGTCRRLLGMKKN